MMSPDPMQPGALKPDPFQGIDPTAAFDPDSSIGRPRLDVARLPQAAKSHLDLTSSHLNHENVFGPDTIRRAPWGGAVDTGTAGAGLGRPAPVLGGPAKPLVNVPPGTLKQSNANRTERTVTAEDQVMIEKVAAPAFFAKIASVTGVSPHDAASADELRLLGDRVVSGVQLYQVKLAAAKTAKEGRLVKAASAALGLQTPQPTPDAPASVLADSEVYAAAAGLLAKRAAEINAAKAASDMPTPSALTEEEEEEAKKKLSPAAPVVA